MRKALLVLAAALCVLRFVNLGDVPFINDEPQLQLLVDRHLRDHTIPVVGLMGSNGVPYGPTALWIYLPLRVFTSNVNWIAAYFAATFVLGLVLVVGAVSKSVGHEAAAWMAALVASSPYLFFSSRSAWDNTFLVVLVAMLVWLCISIDRQRRVRDWVAAGIVGGLIVNLHLMALPILPAAALAVLPRLRERWKESDRSRRSVVVGVAAASLSFIALVFPYLVAVRNTFGSRAGFSFLLPNLRTAVRHAGRYLSWSNMGYLFEGRGYFLDRLFPPVWSRVLHVDPSVFLVMAGWAVFLWTGWAIVRGRTAVPVMQRMAFFSMLFLSIYYGGLLIDINYAHYVGPIWWVMFFLAACALVQAPRWLRFLLKGAALLTITMNMIFILGAQQWIAQHRGTRGAHYGPVHAELERVVREICVDVRARHAGDVPPVSIDYLSVVGVFPFSIEYYFSHDAGCQGSVQSIPFARRLPPAAEVFELDYTAPQDPVSAELAWRRVH